MRTNLVSVSLCLLAAGALAPAAATQQQFPRATNSIELPGAGSITIAYNTLDLAQGQTFKGLTSGNDSRAEMFNTRVIPMRLEGSLQVSAVTTLGGKELPEGKYRFSFRVKDGKWHLVVFEDTGKKTSGQWPDVSSYAMQEKELCALPLDLKDDPKSISKKLTIVPVAGEQSGQGGLNIRFGAAEATVPFTLRGAGRAKPMDSSGERSESGGGSGMGGSGRSSGSGGSGSGMGGSGSGGSGSGGSGSGGRGGSGK